MCGSLFFSLESCNAHRLVILVNFSLSSWEKDYQKSQTGSRRRKKKGIQTKCSLKFEHRGAPLTVLRDSYAYKSYRWGPINPFLPTLDVYIKTAFGLSLTYLIFINPFCPGDAFISLSKKVDSCMFYFRK